MMNRVWLVGLALTLSGCLLPQPDTPVIPPMAPGAAPAKSSSDRAAAPVAAPQPNSGVISNNGGGPIAANSPADTGAAIVGDAERTGGIAAGAAPTTALAPSATLQGTVTGVSVKTVVAQPEVEGPAPQGATVASDGKFSLSLQPGGYFLELSLADGRTLRVDKRLVLQGGESRTLTLTLQGSPLKATLTEEAAVVTPSPSPVPSTDVAPTGR